MLRIAITGGPCAGKTEISSHLVQRLEERGYKVFWVPETATELILNGIVPSSALSLPFFEELVIEKQLSKEELYAKAASCFDSDKVIIFYDRGLLDCMAYISKAEFTGILAKQGLTFMGAVNRYDAVLHLVTTANGAEAFYQWNDPAKEGPVNNAARTETPQEAREKDKATMEAWFGHPHLRVFGNSTDFKGKVDRVVKEVFSLLGEPAPKETERKFLVHRPSMARLRVLGAVSVTDIVQTYLTSVNTKVERRVRQRGTKESGYSFFYTEKQEIYDYNWHGFARMEKEEKISEKQYLNYLLEADTSLHQIVKKRVCFVYKEQFFELDLYACDLDMALLELETDSLDAPVEIPQVLLEMGPAKEVTDNTAYRNYNLAKRKPGKGFLSGI